MKQNNPQVDGTKLRQLMKEKRFTQKRLAEEMNSIRGIEHAIYPERTIKRYLKDGRIALSYLDAIVKVL